mmetsp:Transcript_11017/g.16803  ORF Transcript_11017/g.16803 Transcript_11017/m.16803 type:complete len:146 (+) Transcript_11017:57-494(+)|eukprot:CAMPEP_0185023766 /NCGR_PEP_ID=MMETSP1103-20130426/6396_1 /TAXON_ID=36769 /ORGANISM="Paraphysomonas bandaiensis, Strain Caron Lab Isolate" /LENGTH=145 /DNA_ID=CAMNT_0027556507 /DNA_START=66 /DNA_END=503 /DNA_ORIENTATION=+
MTTVRVGVGCLVRNSLNKAVLIGRRKGSHGAGTLALPGGHLEMGETWEECVSRELLEETNLSVTNIKYVGATNDIAIGGNSNKHYVTIFMSADVATDSSPLENMEPHKCEEWMWKPWDEIVELSESNPEQIFDPLLNFIRSGYTV